MGYWDTEIRSMVVAGVVVGVGVVVVVFEVGVGLVVSGVVIVLLPFLYVGVPVFRILPEQATNNDRDNNEGYHSDHDEPDQGAGIGCSHRGGSGVEVADLQGEGLQDQQHSKDDFVHIQ